MGIMNSTHIIMYSECSSVNIYSFTSIISIFSPLSITNNDKVCYRNRIKCYQSDDHIIWFIFNEIGISILLLEFSIN